MSCLSHKTQKRIANNYHIKNYFLDFYEHFNHFFQNYRFQIKCQNHFFFTINKCMKGTYAIIHIQ